MLDRIIRNQRVIHFLPKTFFVLITILVTSCKEVPQKEEKKPNILFLFTDDQRYSTLGALGLDNVKTPNLDKLVGSGTTFTNSYILGAPHAAVCSPSRAMLMTGRHYFNIPANVYAQFAFKGDEKGKSDLLTFPEHFKANGYKTFTTGKQHNGKYWLERGFDYIKSAFLGGMTTHFGTKVRDYDPTTGWSDPYQQKEKFSSELFADAAIGFLQDYKESDPFLMYVSFTAPHDPRTAPEEFHSMYPTEEVDLPPNFMKEHPFKIANEKIRDERLAVFPREENEVKKHISDYYAMISATDAQIGRILDALEASGQAENTIVVFAGDNGLAVGQHGLLGKQNVYEHSIKVPLLFSGPGIPKNVKKDAFAYLHDVFPTLCGLANLEIPESVETINLTPVIIGEQESVRTTMHYAYSPWPGDIARENNSMESQSGAHRAIRKGDFKLIISSKEGVVTHQLFSVKTDPWELNNLVEDKKYATVKEDLENELKRLIKETGDPAKLDKDEFGLFDNLENFK